MDIWKALIHKSKDGAKSFTRTHEYAKGKNEDTFNKLSPNNKVLAFLGGVGTGIVTTDGVLVFPIQTAHNGTGNGNKQNMIGATIMYSYDNGKTWQMPETNDVVMPNQSSLENMVFQIGDKLVLAGRGQHGSNGKHRWAYYTEDFGKTWQKFEPLDAFQNVTSAPSQGSTIYVTLPSGRKVILVSAPKGKSDSYQRGDMTLYVLSGLKKEQMAEITVFRPGHGNALGAGYSSLAYKGGNLFVAYEDNGDISVKNLTEFIPKIEEEAKKWNLPDERAKDIEKVEKFQYLNELQKRVIIQQMYIDNDREFTNANMLNKEMITFNKQVTDADNELVNYPMILASNLRKYKQSVAKKHTVYKYLGLLHLEEEVKLRKDKFSEKLDFTKYSDAYNKFSYKGREVAYLNDSIYSSIGLEANYIGYNYTFKNYLVGAFIENTYAHNKAYNIGVGVKFNAKVQGIDINNFIRYRIDKLKNPYKDDKNNILGVDNLIRHNLDLYTQVGKEIELNKYVNLYPKAGILLTYSNDLLLNENVRLDAKLRASSDFSVKVEAKYKNFKFKLRPEILITDNAIYLSQSNYSKNKYKVDNKLFEYNMELGVSATYHNFDAGLDVQFNDISRDDTRYGFNLKLGFNM